MQLYSALGGSLNYAEARWKRAALRGTRPELAERLDDVEYQLRALWALWTFRVREGAVPR